MDSFEGFLRGILLSLALHGFIVWGSQFIPVTKVPEASRIEIQVVDQPASDAARSPARQVVRDQLLPDKLKVEQSEDDLAFLSAQTQRVREQTQAALAGKTMNRSPRPAVTPTRRERQRETAKLFKPRALAYAGDSDVSMSDQVRERRPRSNILDLPTGPSTIGEALPTEVKVGSFTALNTDRYLYYTFFVRVEDLIRDNWEDRVSYTIQRTAPERFRANISRKWVTLVDIILEPNGRFARAVLLKGSGIDGFDNAAMDAFAEARLFPNPPREMVQDDGLIHLKYSFTVQHEPRALVRKEDN